MKVAQPRPTLCDPMNYTVDGILQARILQWVAFPFSRGPSQPRDLSQVSHTADGFFTSLAIREALEFYIKCDSFVMIAHVKDFCKGSNIHYFSRIRITLELLFRITFNKSLFFY